MRSPLATTRVAAVIGDPIEHSLSPVVHNAAFEAMGIDWVFVAFRVAGGCTGDALQAMRALGLSGLSVTTPHKEAAAGLVDELSERARRLASVNTVVVGDDGRLYGDSTDGQGFLDALERSCGFDPTGARCLVVGAGGAARAVVLALAEAGAEEVVVVNRSADRAHQAASLAGSRGRVGGPDDVEGADLVVQATTVGMGGDGGDYPVDPSAMGPGQVAADLVYHPVETRFLAAAASQGATVVDGVGMLVCQAARALELWTGMEAPLEVMEQAASQALRLG